MAKQRITLIDFDLSAKQNILAAINQVNGSDIEQREIRISPPTAVEGGDPRETSITLTGVRQYRYTGEKEYRYKRLDLSFYSRLQKRYAIAYQATLDQMLDDVATRLQLHVNEVDVVGNFAIGETISLVAKADSLLYIGQLDINLVSGYPTSTFGSQNLLGGDAEAGYYGEVDPIKFITSTDLAQQCGILPLIESINGGLEGYFDPNASWLKYIYKGKILYIGKQIFAYGLSWNDLDNQGMVFGEKTLIIGDEAFKVRLISGADNGVNTDDDYGYIASEHGHLNNNNEWNDLLWPVCDASPRDANKWDSFTQGELSVGSPADENHPILGNTAYGFNTWCQEYNRDITTERLYRGDYRYNGIDYCGEHNYTSRYLGWRPVLEKIEDE